MSDRPETLDRTLSRTLMLMEADICDVVAWSLAFQSFAMPPEDIDYDVVMVMAKALNKAAVKVKEDWQAAYKLSIANRAEQQGGRNGR